MELQTQIKMKIMLNRMFKFSVLALVALVIVITSCEKEPFVEPLDQTISEDITDILELNDDGSISILAFSEIVTEDSTEATEEENKRRRKVRPSTDATIYYSQSQLNILTVHK